MISRCVLWDCLVGVDVQGRSRGVDGLEQTSNDLSLVGRSLLGDLLELGLDGGIGLLLGL